MVLGTWYPSGHSRVIRNCGVSALKPRARAAPELLPSPDDEQVPSGEAAEVLGERGQVGDGLGGVLVPAERVYHGEVGAGAEPAHLLHVRVGADDKRVQILAEDPAGVLQRLTAGQLEFVRAEGDRIGAKPGGAAPEDDVRVRVDGLRK